MSRWHCGKNIAWLFMMLFCFVQPVDGFDGFDYSGAGENYPARANGRLTERASINASRIVGELVVDGRLDDPTWGLAEAGTGFTRFSPERGGEPCEETVFKVLYDDEAIYFGIACFRHNEAPITSTLSRRDRMTASDRIGIYIDPYHDRNTGYHFRVNPHGVQEDYYCFNDLYQDPSWDAVWEAETSTDEHGWYVELRLPFSSIRYRSDPSMTWGLNVFQYIHSRGERTVWSNWDRNERGFMCRLGTVNEITGIRPSRQLEFLPYTVGRITDPAITGEADEWDELGNFGVDIKYGVTANLTLNAALQPDFGQVEADPAILNLSPYETFFEEKRPFFIEGNQYFEHPDFTLFYSRRIGTGTENSRIRFAGKLTGKTKNHLSVAGLLAATDEAPSGRAHNPFEAGEHKTYYGVGRLGVESADGNRRISLMQTAMTSKETRDAYTSGVDFEITFKEREYNLNGSFVGSSLRPATNDRSSSFGTGAKVAFAKTVGTWRGNIIGRYEHDKLDLNDLGYVRDPDHVSGQFIGYHWYDSDGRDAPFTQGYTEFSVYKTWFYADRSVTDPDNSSQELWSYGRGHHRSTSSLISGWWETKARWALWYGFWHDAKGSSKYETRSFEGERGPLLTIPECYGLWAGLHTDSRKRLSFSCESSASRSVEGGRELNIDTTMEWIQSSRLNHEIALNFNTRHSDVQWVGNYASDHGGIGGVSYVFGDLDQRTWDLTMRNNIVFSRDQSLELYVQPFLSVGDYRNAKELATPDSYDLRPYSAADFSISDFDFSCAAVNFNAVYRWQYAPGSTLYLVWTHTRDRYDARGEPGRVGRFDNGFGISPLFDNEPENRFLIKISHWFAM